MAEPSPTHDGAMTREAVERSAWLSRLAWLPVLTTVVVHGRVLGYFFMAHDFHHLFQAANFGGESLIEPFAGQVAIAHKLVLYLLFELFGMNPLPYFASALLLHAVNVQLLAVLIRRRTGSRALALFGATLWGVAPVLHETLWWCSAHGQIMVTTAVLWILCDFARLEQSASMPSRTVLARWWLLLLVAATSNEFGTAIAICFAGAAWLLLPDTPERKRVAVSFLGLAAMVLVTLAGTRWLYSQVSGETVQLYFLLLGPDIGSSFRVLELLLGLMASSVAALITGPFLSLDPLAMHAGVVRGPFAGLGLQQVVWISDALGVAFLALVVWTQRRAPAAERRWTLALSGLMAVCFGSIVLSRFDAISGDLAGHVAMLRPQHHYLTTSLTSAILCSCLAHFALPRALPAQPIKITLALAAAGIVVLSVLVTSAIGSPRRGNPPVNARPVYEKLVRLLEETAAGHAKGSQIVIPNRRLNIMYPAPAGGLARERQLFPDLAAIFIVTYPGESLDGRRFRFIEPKPALMRMFVDRRPGSRTARLLITEKQAIADGAWLPPR